MIDQAVRKVTTSEEAGTLRVGIDGITAIALTDAYKRLVAAQDDVATILGFLCQQKHLDPASIVGFDDEHGELLIRV